LISANVTPEAVALHYDELDHFYRDVWGDHVHHGLWLRGDETREQAVYQLADLVAREASVPEMENDVQEHVVRKVCDIGCGYGATARLLADRGADVTAITISPAQFAVAQQSRGTRENLRFVLGDWLTNDFPAESFDAAIAIESSEHMPQLSGFFAQAHRVLRPGGRLVVCAWLSADEPSAWAQRWLLEPICEEGRMPQLGTVSDYHSLAEASGFAAEKFQDITRNVARTWSAIVRTLLLKFATEPHYLRFLFSPHESNRVFALTILRIWIAYGTGAMRYGIFTLVKP
jgi:tocopherol O-methyltransferase